MTIVNLQIGKLRLREAKYLADKWLNPTQVLARRKTVTVLVSVEPGVWAPTPGSFHGCFYQVMVSERGIEKGRCTVFINRFVPKSLNYLFIGGWSLWERQVSQKPGNMLSEFPEFFLSLWFQYQLWSHLKERKLWKLVISTEVEHLHAYPVTLHFSPWACITNWNAYIWSPKGMNKKVLKGSICSRLKLETTQVAINNRMENKLWYIRSKADYTAAGTNKLVLHATSLPKENTEWKKPARGEHILNDFTHVHFKNRCNGLCLKYW